MDTETFGGVAPVAGVHAAIVALVLYIPAVVLVAVTVAEDPFPALLLLRFPLSSETGHSGRKTTAWFPHCIPALPPLAPRNRDAVERPTLHHPG